LFAVILFYAFDYVAHGVSSLNFSTTAAIIITAAKRLFACEPTNYDSRRATHPGIDFYRFCRAVQSASAALHAQILVSNPCLSIAQIEHRMRADFGATPTAHALVGGVR
jgi:hypothetical protein